MERLRIREGRVVDSQGQPVFLRGVNIGGWMNMEHFLNGHPGAETNLRRTMQQVLGAEKASFFFERLLDYMFNEQDVAFLQRCGVTAIRLPVNYRHFEDDQQPFQYREQGFARLEQALGWCEEHGIYVILDLHAVQGWQNGDWHCDNSSRHALFWSHRLFQDRFVALWQEFARRYAERPVVAAYNLVNEPLSNAPYGRFDTDDAYRADWPAMNQIYQRAVSAIRSVDPDTIIMLEGDYYSVLFDGLEPPFAENLLYSNHNYIEPAIGGIESYPVTLGATHWDAQEIERQFVATEGYQFAQRHDVPLLVGEFGLSMDYPSPQVPLKVQVLSDQFATYNRLGVHWTFWSYKALGSMGWVQTAPDSPYMRTIALVLRAKAALGVDFGWLAGFPPELQEPMSAINDQIVAHLPGVDWQANLRYLSQAAMSTFTADQVQRLYAQQFAAMSLAEIDAVLASFALENCVVRTEMSEAIAAATRG